MIIFGIDPGTATTGFGVIESKNQKYRLIDGGVIRTKSKTNPATRLKTIHDELSLLLKQHRPAQVAVEKLFFAKNVTTAMAVSQARGVTLLAIEQAGVPIAEYTPLQIKQAVTGYGRAEKSQIQEMVKTLLLLDQVPKPDDAADALAVAITHAMTL